MKIHDTWLKQLPNLPDNTNSTPLTTPLFHFTLPSNRIARYPAHKRSHSKLLEVCSNNPGKLVDHRFSHLPNLLRAGDLLVINNSRVVPARLHTHKPTGGKVEVLFERETAPCQALALLKSNKPLVDGTRLIHNSKKFHLRVGERVEGALRRVWLQSKCYTSWLEVIQDYGEVPLPPYMNRPAEALDKERYQTIYASQSGSVAAPTAGLHFDNNLLHQLKKRGIGIAEVTLHVGYGTFAKPDPNVTSLHAECYQLPQHSVNAIDATKTRGNKVFAVGTTSARVLESVALQGKLDASNGKTTLCIKPGFTFQIVDGLITNFHLPETSLLWLVCALAGENSIKAAYQHALTHDYRFFSYGDAMLIR